LLVLGLGVVGRFERTIRAEPHAIERPLACHVGLDQVRLVPRGLGHAEECLGLRLVLKRRQLQRESRLALGGPGVGIGARLACLRLAVGLAAGLALGLCVRLCLGLAVGLAVGLCLGLAVSLCVGLGIRTACRLLARVVVLLRLLVAVVLVRLGLVHLGVDDRRVGLVCLVRLVGLVDRLGFL